MAASIQSRAGPLSGGDKEESQGTEGEDGTVEQETDSRPHTHHAHCHGQEG